MRKMSDITFLEIMTAGYLSAEAYSVLNSKNRLGNISLSECSLYPVSVAQELRRLFDDAEISEALQCIEALDEACQNNDDRPFELLDTMLYNADKEVIRFIAQTGHKCFIHEYAFAAIKSLLNRNFVSQDNFGQICAFIKQYRTQFCMLYGIETHNDTNPVSSNETISSVCEETSSYRTIVPVDEDALSLSNIGYKKYVVYLSMLDNAAFTPIENYIKDILTKVPVRTQNSVRYLGYQNFCVNYLFSNESKWLKIRNFGRKSVFDLNKVKSYIINYIISRYEACNKDGIEQLVDEETKAKAQIKRSLRDIIGDVQYQVLVEALQRLSKRLSVRAQNGIAGYYGDFIEDFVHQKQSVTSLKNIGKKSEPEIVKVITRLQEMVSSMKDHELMPEAISEIQHKSLYGICWDDFACQYERQYGHLPMFHIVENLVKELLKQRNWQIFNATVPFFNKNMTGSLDETADMYKRTRERCRQICEKYCQFLHDMESDNKDALISIYREILQQSSDWQYLVYSLQQHDYIDISMVKPFLCQEESKLSDDFAMLIVKIIMASGYKPLGRNVMALSNRSKSMWKHTYLVKKELADAFNFDNIKELISETENELEENIERDAEQLVIDTFFSAWTDFHTELVTSVSDVLTFIMINEYGKIPDENFLFTLEGKKKISASDIIYNALQGNGSPMTIDDLFSALDTAYPHRYKSSYSLRSIIASDPRICMVGTANLVGLMEWPHVKVGSIRDIIVQYLSEFDTPQPLADIIAHVQQYRKSSDNSIRSTMGSGKQFVSFEGALYGLRDKTYPDVYLHSESEKQSFANRILELEHFIKTNGHFPLSSSDKPKEESLCRWWKRMLKETDLSEEQQAEISRIQEVFGSLPTTSREVKWHRMYSIYKAFIKEHHRKPAQYSQYETRLYKWFEKTFDDFAEGALNNVQEKLYIELCNLL